MQRTTLPNGLRKLCADDDMLIIYRDDPATASPTVYLGSGDSEENYAELPAAEVTARLAAIEAEMLEAATHADSDAPDTDNPANADGNETD